MASQEDDEDQLLGQDEDLGDFTAIAPAPEEALPPAPLASADSENICVLAKKVGKFKMILLDLNFSDRYSRLENLRMQEIP